ncbi:O-antigen ligase family protein [Paenibacillus xanthanilyticus]|uniref:O-antigen ligase family protein n=1 Tax=Paenibacillus xanthanilyticus TaxID=1783531 RepID=A0ABV8KAY6_9BACL
MVASIRHNRTLILTLLTAVLGGAVLGVSSNNMMLLGLVAGTVLFVALFAACLVNIEVWLVSYAIALTILPQVNVAGMPVQFGDLLFLIGLLIFMYRLKHLKGSVILTAAFLFVVAVIVSVLGVFRYNPGMAFTSFLNAGRIIEVVFPVFLLSTYDRIRYDRIVKWVLSLAVLTNLFGIIQFLIQLPLDSKTVWIGSKKFYRASSIFMESNSFGHFTAAISIALSVLLFEKSRLPAVQAMKGWLIPTGLIISILACLLTFSRGAMLIYLVGIIFYALITRRGSVLIKLAFTVSVPLAGLFLLNQEVYQLLAGRITMTVANMFTDFDSVSGGRVDSWSMAFDVIGQNLLTGIGYKNTVEYFLLYYGEARAGDNNYITILLELGITGLAAFLYLVVSMVFQLAQRKNRVHATMQTILLSVWVSTLIQMFVLDAFTFWRSLTILFVFIGIMLSYKPFKKEVSL